MEKKLKLILNSKYFGKFKAKFVKTHIVLELSNLLLFFNII